MFDVGVIYRRNRDGKLYLSVEEHLLITIDSRGVKEVRPRKASSFLEKRRLKVGDLVKAWKIPISLFDTITQIYLQPMLDELISAREDKYTGRYMKRLYPEDEAET